MDSIKRRMLVLDQKIGCAHVSRQHAFLDQPMRVVARGRNDILDLAALGKQHDRFRSIKIDCAALVACG